MFNRSLPALVILIVGTLFADAAQPRLTPRQEPADAMELFGEKYRLGRVGDCLRLSAAIAERLEASETTRAEWKVRREEMRGNRALSELSTEELRLWFQAPEGVLEGKAARGLKAIQRRLPALAKASSPDPSADEVQVIRELAASVENCERTPVPFMNMFTVGFLAVDFLDNSIGGGTKEAVNVDAAGLEGDPPASMFWTPKRLIESADLVSGFGRSSAPDLKSQVWEYVEPKTGSGSNPGFEVRSGDLRGKVKFGETKSEPFTSRIFHALGYRTDPIDHLPALRIKYDRRIIREFNLRREVLLRFRLLGPPVVTHDLQVHFDPLEFVETAVLTDGSVVPVDVLRRRLFRNSDLPELQSEPDSFDEEFEAQIDHLVMSSVSFQPERPDLRTVGRWDYGQLGHADLRELRGAGLLAAWLGFFDCRFDNTSLRLGCEDDGIRLSAYFSDLGGGLGRSDRAFGWRPENPNEFPWRFTRAAIRRGPGRMTTPFRVVRFHTIADNAAFQAMTDADARWMARRIARLSVDQLKGALIASGMDASETVLYLAKLVARRNQMVADLELGDEFLPLECGFESTDFNYDPYVDGVPEVLIAGSALRAETGRSIIVGGRLVPRDSEKERR